MMLCNKNPSHIFEMRNVTHFCQSEYKNVFYTYTHTQVYICIFLIEKCYFLLFIILKLLALLEDTLDFSDFTLINNITMNTLSIYHHGQFSMLLTDSFPELEMLIQSKGTG